MIGFWWGDMSETFNAYWDDGAKFYMTKEFPAIIYKSPRGFIIKTIDYDFEVCGSNISEALRYIKIKMDNQFLRDLKIEKKPFESRKRKEKIVAPTTIRYIYLEWSEKMIEKDKVVDIPDAKELREKLNNIEEQRLKEVRECIYKRLAEDIQNIAINAQFIQYDENSFPEIYHKTTKGEIINIIDQILTPKGYHVSIIESGRSQGTILIKWDKMYEATN